MRGGDQRMPRGVYVGHHERSGAAIFLTPDGVKKGTRIARKLEHERWDRVFSATCIGIPWQLRPDQQNLARLVVPEAEADQGVALVIVMPAAPRTDRRRYVTKRDLLKYGHTDECQACTQLASGTHEATTDAEIALVSSWQRTLTRDKLSECLVLQRLKSRVRKPEKRWTLVNRWIVWLDRKHSQFHDRWKNSQFPQ